MSADDIVAINQLLAEYNHRIDGGEAEAWAELFADGGSLDTGMGPPVSGTAALADFVRSANQMVPGGRHVISNVSITIDGSTARGRSYLHLWAPGDGGVRVMFSGIYTDTFVKTADGWRFDKRVMKPD